MESTQLRAVIFCRVSSREQAEGKASIPDQISQCKKVIIERGWTLAADPFIDAGISGHLLEERAGLQSLLLDAKSGLFDVVVVKDFDRFARNRSVATQVRDQLKKLLIQTYSISTPIEPRSPKEYDPFDDDLGTVVEGFSDTMAEIERNKIRRRMSMGKIAVANSGRIPNKVPFGYVVQRTLDDKGKVHRKVVIQEDRAKIVRKIFSLYAQGKGRRNISFSLTQEGIPSPNGRIWTDHTLRYMLCNRTYTGKVMWGWRHSDYKVTKQRRDRG